MKLIKSPIYKLEMNHEEITELWHILNEVYENGNDKAGKFVSALEYYAEKQY